MADDDPKIDTDPVTCWGFDYHHESMERAKREWREQQALWMWIDECLD